MKRRWILVCLLIIGVAWVLFAPMLPRQIVVPSITFKIIDEQTGLPLEGIKVHTDCRYAKSKLTIGIFARYGQTNEICLSSDFVSDKDGVVAIPARTKISSNYGSLDEYYWINLSQVSFDKNGLPDYFTTNCYPKPLNALHEGVSIRRYGLSSSNESPMWQMEGSPLVNQNAPNLFMVRLRRNSHSAP